MNLVDSSGWLEYFANGKNADFFAPAIQDTSHLVVSTVNIFEVYKKILLHADRTRALQAVGSMQRATVADVTAWIAIKAAEISRERKIPMADSLIYATAREYDAILWTQDEDFRDMEKVRFIRKR